MGWPSNCFKNCTALCSPNQTRLDEICCKWHCYIFWARYKKIPLYPTKKEIKPLFQLGILFSVQLLFLNIGISKTSVSSSVILNSTYPIWVITLGHFFIKEDRFSLIKLFGVSIAYLGIVVTYFDSFGNSDFILGNSLCLASGFLLGVRTIFLAKSSESIAPMKLLMAQAFFGSIFFIILSIFFESDPYVFSVILLLSILYQFAFLLHNPFHTLSPCLHQQLLHHLYQFSP